ncbi:MAG: TIGR03089 family protein [Actinobacteria bacterium]|nr:TIGR03089 family protein [Actinomycetota bacterium]MCG2799850.1 TIGR03089 family protein [Cellulomonas sp.]
MQENPGAQVLTTVLKDPGRPRITWYGPDGERVELSGAVLANWVAKTAHLLIDELDAGPGTQVRLDLPAHWRTVVWALACWHIGAVVRIDDEPADVVVTDQPGRGGTGGAAVAVALPALARTFGTALPAGTLDYAATVLGHPDTAPPSAVRDPGATALVGTGGHLTVAALDAQVDRSPVRRLVRTTRPLDELLATVRATLAGGGSVVITDGFAADRIDALVKSERIDAQEASA